VLCVLLSTVALTNAVGRVLTRRGMRLDQRGIDDPGCAATAVGLSGKGTGYCSAPGSQPCTTGSLIASTGCPSGQKCCVAHACTWQVPESDPLHSDFSSLSGYCQSSCSMMPNRRAITPSGDCGAIACCIILPSAGTVGQSMDDDADRIKKLSSWKCAGGTCDPLCATGTLEPDTSGVCGGGQCCRTDSDDPSAAGPTASAGLHQNADDDQSNVEASPSHGPDEGGGDPHTDSTDTHTTDPSSAPAPAADPSAAPSL